MAEFGFFPQPSRLGTGSRGTALLELQAIGGLPIAAPAADSGASGPELELGRPRL